jgi:hypothetical protein
MSNFSESQIMDLVRKALSVDSATGASIAPFMKESLEDEAYVQLYSERDKAQMSLLKDLPRVQAGQVAHEFTIVDTYGNHKAKASFAANSLPTSANIGGTKKVVNLKLYGKTSSVQGLTVLQNTIRAMGQPTIASANDMAVRRLLMYMLNTDMYASDTRCTLDNNQFKGFFQLIDELTKSPSATTFFSNSDIFIDMRGQPLLPQQIRSQAVGLSKRNSILRRIYMAPEVLETIENNLDPAARFMIAPQASTQGMIVGNSIDGMRVQGEIVYFRRENALSTLVKTGTANGALIEGAPMALVFGGMGAGSITQPAVNIAGVGKFATTGERLTGMTYIVTAVNDVGESLYSNTSAPVNATVGKTIELTITPRGDETSFRVYRGYNLDLGQVGSFMEPKSREPMFIFEIPNGASLGNTTPITFVDDDQMIPGTTWCWGGDVWSPNAEALDLGQPPADSRNEYEEGRSAAAIAQLTGLFEFDLAKLGWLFSNKLFANVLAPQVPKPFANVVWINVGGNEQKKSLIDRVY